MSTATVSRLGDVRLADAAEVGGKAASLGELLASGVRVPNGVVVTADAVEMAADDRRTLLRAGVAELGVGPFAVRSSGIAEDGVERSFAGMFESVLDVSGDELSAAVEKCLASAGALRVGKYARNGDRRMAVIIQRMVASTSDHWGPRVVRRHRRARNGRSPGVRRGLRGRVDRAWQGGDGAPAA